MTARGDMLMRRCFIIVGLWMIGLFNMGIFAAAVKVSTWALLGLPVTGGLAFMMGVFVGEYWKEPTT